MRNRHDETRAASRSGGILLQDVDPGNTKFGPGFAMLWNCQIESLPFFGEERRTRPLETLVTRRTESAHIIGFI